MTGPALIIPKGIIFDWDNTLVDSWGCIQAAMNHTLSAMGHAEWGMEEMKSRVALSLRDSFPTLFKSRWQEARDVFYAAFSAIHLDCLKPLPGAVEMLEALADCGVRLSVVSNKNGGYLRQEASVLGWNRFFDCLVGATDAEEDKPAAAPVRLALKSMRCGEGESVWFAGDAAVDMICAANSGCIPVLLRADAPKAGEFDACPFHCHLEGCGALSALVREQWVPISAN